MVDKTSSSHMTVESSVSSEHQRITGIQGGPTQQVRFYLTNCTCCKARDTNRDLLTGPDPFILPSLSTTLLWNRTSSSIDAPLSECITDSNTRA